MCHPDEIYYIASAIVGQARQEESAFRMSEIWGGQCDGKSVRVFRRHIVLYIRPGTELSHGYADQPFSGGGNARSKPDGLCSTGQHPAVRHVPVPGQPDGGSSYGSRTGGLDSHAVLTSHTRPLDSRRSANLFSRQCPYNHRQRYFDVHLGRCNHDHVSRSILDAGSVRSAPNMKRRSVCLDEAAFERQHTPSVHHLRSGSLAGQSGSGLISQ